MLTLTNIMKYPFDSMLEKLEAFVASDMKRPSLIGDDGFHVCRSVFDGISDCINCGVKCCERMPVLMEIVKFLAKNNLICEDKSKLIHDSLYSNYFFIADCDYATGKFDQHRYDHLRSYIEILIELGGDVNYGDFPGFITRNLENTNDPCAYFLYKVLLDVDAKIVQPSVDRLVLMRGHFETITEDEDLDKFYEKDDRHISNLLKKWNVSHLRSVIKAEKKNDIVIL